ncbi:MAG: family containing protein [Candidatus Eremiobacteraeota bacterium]|nr:family containing protein [Candidatus Eremiobacteraeota bacterium]
MAPFARAMWRFPPDPRGATLDDMLYSAYDVVELRRYAMRPGCRDTLIALFERAFIDSQEAAGMVPVGHYRDLDDPESYVWFRGFPRRERRHDALHEFYTSPTWLEHRGDANATLLDSDNVLLLRNARSGSGFDLDGLTRPNGTESIAESFVVVFLFMLDGPPGAALLDAFEHAVIAVVRSHASRVAAFVTDEHPNDYPRLPVREGEWAAVVTGVAADANALAACVRAVEELDLPPAVGPHVVSRETLRLAPASRSLLR